MNEQAPKSDFEKEWASLSFEEQETCAYFSSSEWSTGVGERQVIAMGYDMQVIESLVAKGFMQRKTIAEYAQEYVGAHQARFEAIEARWSPLKEYQPELTPEEQNFKSLFKSHQSSVTSTIPALRYRLKSEAFHDFAHSKLT